MPVPHVEFYISSEGSLRTILRESILGLLHKLNHHVYQSAIQCISIHVPVIIPHFGTDLNHCVKIKVYLERYRDAHLVKYLCIASAVVNILQQKT